VARPTFPRTLAEFQARFAGEAACRAYLAASRWPDGYRCPRCRHSHAFELSRRHLWQCKACGHQTSVTAGTVLHRTRTSLKEWFWAEYLVTTHTPGMSALQRQRQLGIRRYETAWTMLQKLRRAMLRPQREPLRDKVEVDETYIGNQEGLRGGRELGARALVVGAVKVRGRASGRVRLRVVPDASAASLAGFVKANVASGTIVITDGWQGYAPLSGMGYRHRPKTQGRPERAEGHPPTRPSGLRQPEDLAPRDTPRRRDQALQACLDEFTFRFNRRRTPMAAFQSLLSLTGAHEPTTYKMLYGSESTG
jgi:transposase-like protein